MRAREPGHLTFDEAAEYLGIPRKYLDNYAKKGHEIPYTHGYRRRLIIAKEELDSWKERRQFRSVELTKGDYVKSLEFGVGSFYRYSTTINFRGPTQRGAGKFVTNFTEGKLGELAVKRFFNAHFNVDLTLDFTFRDAIVGQDISEVIRSQRGMRVSNPPRLRVSIKTTKLKNVWLAVGQKEVESPLRTSDVYILSRVELPIDHFFRLFKEHEALTGLREEIPDLSFPLKGEVAGYAYKDELDGPVEQINGQKIQPSYVKRSGELLSSVSEWKDFIDKL